MTQQQRTKLAFALADAAWKTAKENKADYATIMRMCAVLLINVAEKSGMKIGEVVRKVALAINPTSGEGKEDGK